MPKRRAAPWRRRSPPGKHRDRSEIGAERDANEVQSEVVGRLPERRVGRFGNDHPRPEDVRVDDARPVPRRLHPHEDALRPARGDAADGLRAVEESRGVVDHVAFEAGQTRECRGQQGIRGEEPEICLLGDLDDVRTGHIVGPGSKSLEPGGVVAGRFIHPAADILPRGPPSAGAGLAAQPTSPCAWAPPARVGSRVRRDRRQSTVRGGLRATRSRIPGPRRGGSRVSPRGPGTAPSPRSRRPGRRS